MTPPVSSDPPMPPADRVAVAIATFFGAGYFPVGPGTAGSVAAVLIYWFLLSGIGPSAYLGLVAIVVVLGIWSATRTERIWGHDAGRIVIDEVAGQLLTLAVLSGTPGPERAVGTIFGLLLFRVFDIWKPFPIRRLERLRSGTGVMADDLGAGALAMLVLWLIGPLTRALAAGLANP
jgi:phosphatidylglycerophosphatase A